MKKVKTVSISFKPDILKKLDMFAEEQNFSRSLAINFILSRVLSGMVNLDDEEEEEDD